MPIFVSKKNPRLSIKDLNKLGYKGNSVSEVLKKIKKHYPKARKIK